MRYKKLSHISKRNTFRFRRFCRAAYAVFNSLHREVTIGRLATYVADHQLRKSAVTALSMFMLMPLMANSQEDDAVDVQSLPVLQIVAPTSTALSAAEPAVVLTSQDISNHTVQSIGDLLTLVAGVDLRVRGTADIQGDLSMRGGSFDQMLVLVNGINLTDAQTGHHLLDIPIDITMVERVEVLTPSMLLSWGFVAFCGAVNIVVNEKDKDRIMAEVGMGSDGTARLSALATAAHKNWTHTIAASYARSDGYMKNTDYNQANLFLQSDRKGLSDRWSVSAGAQIKDFGSQAFYSVSYPDQFEATRTLTLTASNVHLWKSARLETDIYGRLHSDRFELFREGRVEAPAWYGGHNYHISEISGARTRYVRRIATGDLFLGVEMRSEGIVSSVLGEPDTEFVLCRQPSKYNHSASRVSANVFGGYRFDFNSGSVEGVLLGSHNNVFGTNYGASIDAVWQPARQWRLGASLTRAFRTPTFTDLYYQGVNQVANPDLNSERSLSAEVKARYVTTFSGCRLAALASLYYRAGRDIIDWVRRPDEELWYSMNHTVLDAMGAEFTFMLHVGSGIDEVGCSYSYCTERQDAAGMMSAYNLEYLRHKANMYVVLSPARILFANDAPVSLKCDVNYRNRQGFYIDNLGNETPYADAFIINTSIEYAFPKVTLSFRVHNIGDCKYRDYGGVPQPGRSFMFAAKMKL